MTATPSSRAPAPGMVIAGRFRLLRMLGQGGMGSVWAAHHASLDSEVAIKFIDPDIADRAEILSRFSQEAMAAAKIKSPHVVNIFDHGVDEVGRPFIAMELLKGEDLAGRLDRLGTLSLAETAEVVRQAAKGLAKAHAAGVVHRDLKPENLFLLEEEDGGFHLKILDFGIAKSQNQMGPSSGGHKTATGQLIGTPMYMSPEQALGRVLDPRSDLYSLAVVAYRCVTGRPPFVYDALGELIVAVSTLPAPPPSTFRSDVPPSVDAWFARALEKDPARRFPSAKALGETFAQVCGGHDLPSSSQFAAFDGRVDSPPESAPTLRGPAPARTAPALNVPAAVRDDGKPGKGAKLAVAAVVGLAVVGGAVATLRHGADSRSSTAASGAPSGSSDIVEVPAGERAVNVRFEAAPHDATLFWDGQPLGENPYVGKRPLDGRNHKLRAEAAGHQAVEQFVRADGPIELSVNLPTLVTAPSSASPAASASAPSPSNPPAPVRSGRPRAPVPAASASAAPVASPPPSATPPPDDPSKKPRTGVSLDKDDPWKK